MSVSSLRLETGATESRRRRRPWTGLRPPARVSKAWLERRDLFAEIVFAASKTLLKSSEHFVLFAVGKREIIIGELRIFLLQLAFRFVPIAFEFEFGHSKKGIVEARSLARMA